MTSIGDAIVVLELSLFSVILFLGAFVNLDRWSVVSVQNTHILLVAACFFIFNLKVGGSRLDSHILHHMDTGVTRVRKGLRITGLVDFSIAVIIGTMVWLSSMSGTWF